VRLRSLLVCLLALCLKGQEKPALLVFLDAPDPGVWEKLAASRGWRFLSTSVPPTDQGIKSLESQVTRLVKDSGADPARVYLAGQDAGVASVFLAASRVPGLWTAAVAIEGSARPAIGSNKLFGMNTQLVPVLWFTSKPDRSSREKLAAAGFNVEVRDPSGATARQSPSVRSSRVAVPRSTARPSA